MRVAVVPRGKLATYSTTLVGSKFPKYFGFVRGVQPPVARVRVMSVAHARWAIGR